MSEQENVEFFRRWFEEVWNQGHLEAVEEMMAADAVGFGQGGPDAVIRGPADFRTFVSRFRRAFPDIKLSIEDAFGNGDRVALRWSAVMTHLGDDLGIAATGKRVMTNGISIARIRGGKIVEGWDNWDQFGLLQKLGAVQTTSVSLM
jgi:steroid delta-isomerase-like uncharacterized protein